jgi:putative endonuclease
MFYIYLIKSQQNEQLYIDYTNDLRRRFEEHNAGLSAATKPYRPYTLVYYEAYQSIQDARKREIKLKRFKNTYARLRERLSDSLGKTQKAVGGGKSGHSFALSETSSG